MIEQFYNKNYSKYLALLGKSLIFWYSEIVETRNLETKLINYVGTDLI